MTFKLKKMSTIKNLVKTFKERKDEETVPTAEIKAETLARVGEETPQYRTPKAVKTAAKVPKPVKNEPKITKTTKNKLISDEKPENTEGVFSLSDAFFMTLNEQAFGYDKSKFAYIDKKIYEVLMTIKRKKDVKNISTLINAALAQFIEQNKNDIKKIMLDDLF